MTDKRNRRSREEMHAYYQGKADKLMSQMDGSYDDAQEDDVLKAVKRRLRKTATAFKAAQITLNGIEGKDGKGWTRAPIEDKIETTLLRLSQQRLAQTRANEQVLQLPFDIDILTATVKAGDAGEIVEFPDNLHALTLKEEEAKTDEEIEAEFIAEN